jgi:hypothetical protein
MDWVGWGSSNYGLEWAFFFGFPLVETHGSSPIRLSILESGLKTQHARTQAAAAMAEPPIRLPQSRGDEGEAS